MPKFITGDDLSKAVYDIIWYAEETLLIVSPFIKLDDYFKTLFDHHANNPKLHLVLVFGKNESDVRKSMSKADFDYFKKFMNVSIIFVPNLHAKYYGNEIKGVITSINLYDHSFKNNIEFGVFSETNILSSFTTSADKQAWQTCWKIAEENEAIFIKRPVYQKPLFSILVGKKYIKSDVLHDVTDKFYTTWKRNTNTEIKKITDFQNELELGPENTVRPTREEVEKTSAIEIKPAQKKYENAQTGYCIRTGVKIPFNPKKPFCDQAYRTWAQFGNWDYPESYCHKTGQPSHGNTTFRNPILY